MDIPVCKLEDNQTASLVREERDTLRGKEKLILVYGDIVWRLGGDNRIIIRVLPFEEACCEGATLHLKPYVTLVEADAYGGCLLGKKPTGQE